MANPRPKLDTEGGPDRGSTTGMPRWVKVSAIIAAVLALLVVIVMLVGGGNHGPGRHTSSESTSPASVTDSVAVSGHTPPAGGHG
jgi:hypothetical protein